MSFTTDAMIDKMNKDREIEISKKIHSDKIDVRDFGICKLNKNGKITVYLVEKEDNSIDWYLNYAKSDTVLLSRTVVFLRKKRDYRVKIIPLVKKYRAIAEFRIKEDAEEFKEEIEREYEKKIIIEVKREIKR